MEMFDYAIQMEKDGELYYRELAEKSADRGVRSILTLLADAEIRHQRLFEAMKKRTNPELTKDTVISDVKNIFIKMKESKNDITVDASQKELYKRAQELESKSEAFYLEKAEQAGTSEQKELYKQLAAEEKKHYVVLENLIDFITRPEPGNWLENSEWHHLDEY